LFHLVIENFKFLTYCSQKHAFLNKYMITTHKISK